MNLNVSRRITSKEESEKKKQSEKEREKNLHEQKKGFSWNGKKEKNHGEKLNFEPEPKTKFSGSRIKENRERKK